MSVAPMERVKAIQAQLASSTDLNPIVELMEIARSLHAEIVDVPEKQVLKALTLAIRVLSQSFVAMCSSSTLDISHVNESGFLLENESGNDSHAQVSRWMAQQWNSFLLLVHEQLLLSPVSPVRLAALEVSMSLEVAACESLSCDAGKWSTTPFRVLVNTLLNRSVAEDVVDAMAESYLEIYDDVRYEFCKEAARILRKIPDTSSRYAHVRSHVRTFLVRITAIPTEDDHLNNFLVPHLSKAPKRKKVKASQKLKFGEDGEGSEEDEDMKEAMSLVQNDQDSEDENADIETSRNRRARRSKTLRELMHGLAAQRQAFASAWLTLLLPATQRSSDGSLKIVGGPLSLAETHDTLLRLHAQILPHLPKPTMLHDFLVDCLDTRGTTALLALNGLYTLIISHNLDYPAFYTRLYGLLDASVMHTKYRSRFMRMLDTFLSSTHLPVAIVASFLKRLSRLSLRATPAAIVEIVPFIWNLLRRHPSCMQMIHREWNGDHLALGPTGIEDPFDPNEPNPLNTNALDSSLWEVAALGAYHLSLNQQQRTMPTGGDTHYLGTVTTFASILAEPFTQQKYNLEEFLDTTYGTLFDTEARKTLQHKERSRPKAPPAVASLDVTLNVPPMLPTKSATAEQATRRETRKRLRNYAFPTEESDTVGDVCTKLWRLS
ncbi:Maturation and nuclear export of 40S ribosomal subunits interacting protein [Malassezia psittaci]|uniref:Maturation and nuclear export of 40S ribosomal subunits interacting protein n=1 Tax=Malassezia psittaci TaxID=1821823 RepID=A0AAF0JIZ9_9BASI|nr:Maturation and nuclear export of 40S ribosomal subunits interacting protein [Malassezia psittaci]